MKKMNQREIVTAMGVATRLEKLGDEWEIIPDDKYVQDLTHLVLLLAYRVSTLEIAVMELQRESARRVE